MSPSTRRAPEGATGTAASSCRSAGGVTTDCEPRFRRADPPDACPATAPKAEASWAVPWRAAARTQNVLPTPKDPTRMVEAHFQARCRLHATTTSVAAGVISEVPPRARQQTHPKQRSSMTRGVMTGTRRASLHVIAPYIRKVLRWHPAGRSLKSRALQRTSIAAMSTLVTCCTRRGYTARCRARFIASQPPNSIAAASRPLPKERPIRCGSQARPIGTVTRLHLAASRRVALDASSPFKSSSSSTGRRCRHRR